MGNVQLTVTPGQVWTDETRATAATLNATAVPKVEIPAGAGISAEHLDVPGVTAALGDSLRGKNYLRRPSFWYEDWLQPDAFSAPAGSWSENALDWLVKPTGGAVEYKRLDDAPNNDSDFCALVVGGAGVTSADIVVHLPAAVAGSLRGSNLTFSVQVKNLTGATAALVPVVWTCDTRDNKSALTEAYTGSAQNVSANVWTRLSFTFDAATVGNFRLGAFIGFRTTSLGTNLKSLQIAQGQLEVGTVATNFIRPQMPAVGKEEKVAALTDDDKSSIWRVAIVRSDGGLMRMLENPPATWIKPRLGWKNGIPQWVEDGENKLVFAYTGSVQILTIPSGITTATFKVWGAGGCSETRGYNPTIWGGVGGYCKGTLTVSAGQQYAIVVGRGKLGVVGRNYGFGGSGQGSGNHGGGGLSGVFTGTGELLDTDSARALIIAGGGGAGGQTGGGNNATQGGNGGDPARSGGMATFQGQDAYGVTPGGGGGGGGGYNGGTSLNLGGKGGTNFLHASVTAQTNGHASYPSLVVPGSTDPDYAANVGEPDFSGRVVVILT